MYYNTYTYNTTYAYVFKYTYVYIYICMLCFYHKHNFHIPSADTKMAGRQLALAPQISSLPLSRGAIRYPQWIHGDTYQKLWQICENMILI